MTDAGQTDATVTVDGQNYTVQLATLPTSPVQDVAVALADYAGVDVSEVSVSTVGPTWGETVSRKALQALVIFFILLALVPLVPVRVEDGRDRDHRGDPRHHRRASASTRCSNSK